MNEKSREKSFKKFLEENEDALYLIYSAAWMDGYKRGFIDRKDNSELDIKVN